MSLVDGRCDDNDDVLFVRDVCMRAVGDGGDIKRPPAGDVDKHG